VGSTDKKVTTLACLFLSKGGHLSVQLIEPPVPEEFQTPAIPLGMLHAVRLLGMADQIRVFKRIAEGTLPVYEEV
jgi:hypothetical protein